MKTAKSSTFNQVRINAGVWRSRVLQFPDAVGLRPTPDRVRQTLFNWLGQDLTGKTCLDLFAGTGALGFEAASRNAKSVTMIEFSSPVFKALQQSERLLNTSAIQNSKLNSFTADNSKLNSFERPKNIQLIQVDAMQFLAQNQQRFDIIFCDPPYNQNWLDKILPLLEAHLATDGVVYVEAEYALNDSECWQVQKRGKAGAVFYHLLKST